MDWVGSLGPCISAEDRCAATRQHGQEGLQLLANAACQLATATTRFCAERSMVFSPSGTGSKSIDGRTLLAAAVATSDSS